MLAGERRVQRARRPRSRATCLVDAEIPSDRAHPGGELGVRPVAQHRPPSLTQRRLRDNHFLHIAANHASTPVESSGSWANDVQYATQGRMNEQGKNRRRHERRETRDYIPISAPGWSDYSVWGMDISKGGICLALERRVKVGDRFIFQVDGKKRLQAEVCNIRRVEDEERFVAGLRWINDNAKGS